MNNKHYGPELYVQTDFNHLCLEKSIKIFKNVSLNTNVFHFENDSLIDGTLMLKQTAKERERRESKNYSW